MKNNYGITLVALVVTIIVLIILATVSIQFILGENGIISRASEAALETRGGTVKERVTLWRTEKTMETQTKNKTELLNGLQTEGLLKNTERVELENTGKVKIGSHTIELPNSINLSLTTESQIRFVSFYSIDNGATWTAMQENKLKLDLISGDILIYLFFDLGYCSSYLMAPTYPSVPIGNVTKPIYDTTGFVTKLEGCYKITVNKDIDQVCKITGVIV